MLDKTGAVTLSVVCLDPFVGVIPGKASVASVAATRTTACGVLFVFHVIVTVPEDGAAKQAALVLASLDNSFH